MVLELLDCVKVVKGEREVWWEVESPHVVIGGAKDNVGVHVVRVDCWCGEGKVLWVGAQYLCVCVCGELAGELCKLVWV